MSQNCGTARLAPPAGQGAGPAVTPASGTALDLPHHPLASRAARRPGGRRGRLPRLSGTHALVLLASLVVSLLAASSAPTPLYATYQQRWDFSPITTTIVFGVYALAVLASLLTLGRLS